VRPNPYCAPPLTINEDDDPPDAAELERRLREGVETTGRGLVGGLLAALLERGGRLRTQARAERLERRDGAVVGVVAGGKLHEGSVVLASGGFERDGLLVRSFLRGPMLAPGSPGTNRGDALRMGMAAGAALGNMSEAWWCPAMRVPGETIDGAPFYRMLFVDLARPGSLVVDRHGHRFVDEASNYNELGRALLELDAASFEHPRVPSFAIFDAGRRRRPRLGPLDPRAPDPPWLASAPTLEGLAARVGLPPAALCETVERFNAQAARGTDEDFGRGAFAYDRFSSGPDGDALAPVAEPPFYALEVLPGCLGTKGGPRTDAQGRVLRAEDGEAIPGLHAAGNAAANPFGCAYPGGGGTIGPALVFGWAAGEAAAV
jgi:succinate dehydrogenase/fumarate reductase flavoprotein subunit